ncbi:hypothetical protein BDZ94DRAFT_501802 [Collybia nuda]|uniref:Uncharacterized protein n=1 Tax=Collybia nuda TaxID=64659 RepID=A0A9P5XUE5_9AGAR|nr:hypothetical protein BDZ94DRAFT_501802 [Collybia nuda]
MTIMQSTNWTDVIRITCANGPTSWRILNANNTTNEELVFTLQGIITAKDLPPVLQQPHLLLGHFKYLWQSITVSGLGIHAFDQAMAAAVELYGIFDRSFANGQMDTWSTSSTPGLDMFSRLDSSNRYMTPQRDELKPNTIHSLRALTHRAYLKTWHVFQSTFIQKKTKFFTIKVI